jgi:hypothetical protein
MRRGKGGLLVVVGLLASCGSARPQSAATTAPTSSPALNSPSPSPTLTIHVPPIPDGVYETTVTRADARRFGVFRCEPEEIDESTGHITLRLQAGRFRWDITADHPIVHTSFTGIYTGSRTRVTFLFDPNTADEGADTLRWIFDGKALHFIVVRALPGGHHGPHFCVARMQYEAHPWRKSG